MNDNEKLIFLLDCIILDKYPFVYNNTKYYLTSVSLDTKIEAGLLYNQLYNDNLYNDCFMDDDLVELLLIDYKIIPYNHKALYKKIEEQIETTKIDLYKNFYNLKSKNYFKKNLANKEHQLSDLYAKQHLWDFLLLDYYCNKIKIEYMLCHSIFTWDNKLVFDYNDLNYHLFNAVFPIVTNNLRSLSKIRQLSKNNIWRNYWNANKERIFAKSTDLWSDDQRALVNLSRMYDSVYDSMDCPNDDIIDDDDALDGWFLQQKRKRIAEKKQKGVDQLLGKAKNSSEIFMMASDQEDVQEILDMNSPEALKIYHNRIETVKNSTRPIQEAEFSDVKNKLIQELKDMSK